MSDKEHPWFKERGSKVSLYKCSDCDHVTRVPKSKGTGDSIGCPKCGGLAYKQYHDRDK